MGDFWCNLDKKGRRQWNKSYFTKKLTQCYRNDHKLTHSPTINGQQQCFRNVLVGWKEAVPEHDDFLTDDELDYVEQPPTKIDVPLDERLYIPKIRVDATGKTHCDKQYI